MNEHVVSALGLPEDADAASVLCAIAELKAAVEGRTGVQPQHIEGFGDMASINVEYGRRVREIAAEERRRQDEERRERLLAVAVAEGRIKESETDASSIQRSTKGSIACSCRQSSRMTSCQGV